MESEISKAKNHFLDKIKRILEREDLMRSIPRTGRGTTIETKSIDSIWRMWLAVEKIAKVLQPLLYWNIGQESAHTFHNNSKMVKINL